MPQRRSAAAAVVVITNVLLATSVAGTVLLGCPGRDPQAGEGEAGGEGEGEGEGGLPPQCADDTNKPVTPGNNAIYFGTRTPTMVPLTASQLNAIVGVTDDQTFGAFCSGTLISPDVVMTAVHCTTGISAAHLRVLFGQDDTDPVYTSGVAEKRETDADTDLAIIRLDHAPTAAEVDVTPIPIPTDDLSNDDDGILVENAGFGENEDGGYSGRFFVTEVFDGFDADFLQVNGEGTRGVCFGDSGGPSLRVSAAGDVRALGALSFGDAACGHIDNYARADKQRDLIEEFTGPTPAATPVACTTDVTEQGSCDIHQAVETHCDVGAGTIVRAECADGTICAAGGDGNFRCINESDNACGGISAFGTCAGDDGNTLRWCDNGALKERDCGACEERCLLSSPAEGFSCVESDCGDLDHTGVCDGDTSKWCDERGQVQEEDCAAEGTTCEFLGEVLGNYCIDTAACQGLDFQGECQGTLLRWCEDNEVNEVDCADTGGTCILIDDATGFDCSQ